MNNYDDIKYKHSGNAGYGDKKKQMSWCFNKIKRFKTKILLLQIWIHFSLNQ